MASTIRDEQGNPIQLTDEHGSPVHLTDEHGDSVQIIGIATTKQPPTSFLTGSSDQVTGTGLWSSTAKSEDAMKGTGIHETDQRFQGGRKKEEQTWISSTSILGSPEDDGQGGRRGLKQKIKEKLTGGKHGEEHGHTVEVDTTTTAGPAGEKYQEHQKKGVVEKIKEKLPGHHGHH